MIRSRNLLVLLLLALSLTACRKESAESKDAIARVHESYLSRADLEGLVAEGTPTADSLQLVSDYIDNWVRRQLLLKIAEENLPDRIAEVEKQAENYREALLIHAFEEGWLDQRLDTVVSETEMMDYMEANRARFILKETIFQMDYVVLDENPIKMDSLKIWFADTERFKDEIDIYCLNECLDYFIESDRWFSISDLKESFPGIELTESELRLNRPIEIVGDRITCLFRVTDKRIKGRPGPFSYFEEDIMRITLNTRKKELLKKTYQDIYLDGKKKNQFEIYE